jgi:hypothetical protein
MKPSIKLALAAFVLLAGLSLNAQAAPRKQSTQDQDAAPAITPGPYHTVIPCDAERAAMKTSCKKNPCTGACKDATKAMKACRTTYHLPAPPPPVGAKKVVCSPGNVNSHPIDQNEGTAIEDQGYVNGNRNGVINNNTVQPGQ